MPACLFCSIAAGETDASIVWSDDDFVAFLDIRPLFKGHTLLVPREHVVTLPDLPAALRDPFLAAAQRLARAMVDGLGAAGVVRGDEQHRLPVGAAPALPRRAAHQGRRAARASSGRARSTPTTRRPGRLGGPDRTAALE